jgi:hypothetical protein
MPETHLSKGITAIKAKSLHDELKKRMGKLLIMGYYFLQVMACSVGSREGQVCLVINLLLRLNVLTRFLDLRC